ncbi:Paxillin [Gallus gallus] [Rhizoctonia solani]|uniref:Paxillin [Gallus gallus] n=1 Tax=Rhizoctonia solani TaxID=456999 RepID=A0A0K6GG24_9AGAM|nr:Paxillin [Gallus gallus] [Rhizoctonia solani]
MSHGFYSQTPFQQQYPPQQYAQPQTPYPTLDRTLSYSAPGHSPQPASNIGYSANQNPSTSDLMAAQQHFPASPYPPQAYAPYGQQPAPAAQPAFSPFAQPPAHGYQQPAAAPTSASRFQHQHSQSVPASYPQSAAFPPGQPPGGPYGAQPAPNGIAGYPPGQIPAAQYGAVPASQQQASFRTTQSAVPPRNSAFIPPMFGSRARSAEPLHPHADLMRAPTVASARSLDSALVNNRPLPHPAVGTTGSLPSVRERSSTLEGSPGSKQFTYPGFESPTKTGYIPYNRPSPSSISPASSSPPKPTYAAQATANPRTAPFDPFSASRISQMASSPPKPAPSFGAQPTAAPAIAPPPPFAPTWPQEKAKPDISVSTSSSSKFTAGLGSSSSSPTRRPNPPFAPNYKRDSSPSLPPYSSSKTMSPPTARASLPIETDWEEKAQEWGRERNRAEDAIARAHEVGRSFLQERGVTQPKSEAAAIAEEYLARKGISPTRSNPSPERPTQTVKDYATTPPTRRFQSPEKGNDSWRTSTLGRKDRWAEQKGDYTDQKWTQAARRRGSPERGESPERHGGYSSPERRTSPANGNGLPPKPRSQRTFPSDGDYVQHRSKESFKTNGTSRHRHQFSEPTRSPRNDYNEPPEDDYEDPPPPPDTRRRSQEVGRRSNDEARRSYDEARRSHDEVRRSHDGVERNYDESRRSHDEGKRTYKEDRRSYHEGRRSPDEEPYEYNSFEQAPPSHGNYDTWHAQSRRGQERDSRPIPQDRRSPPRSRQSSPERPPPRQPPPPQQRPSPQPQPQPQPQPRPSPKTQPSRPQPASPVTSPQGPNGRPPQQSGPPQRQSMAMRMAAQALADEGGKPRPSNAPQPRTPVRQETRQDVYERSPASVGRRELPPRTPSPPPSATEEEYEEYEEIPPPQWRQPPPPPSPRKEPVNTLPRKGLARVPPPPPPQPPTPVAQEDEYEYEYDEPQWGQPVQKARLADVPKREPLRENIQPALNRPRPPARRDTSPTRREPTPMQREPTPIQREPTPMQREPTPMQREPTPIQREPTPLRREASRDAALRRPVPPPPPPPAPMSPPQSSQRVSLARQPPPPPQAPQHPQAPQRPQQIQERPRSVQERPRPVQERPQSIQGRPQPAQERPPPPIRSPSPARAPAIAHRDDDPAPAPGLPSFSFDLTDEPPAPAGPAISVTSPRQPDSTGPRIEVDGAEPPSINIVEDSRPQLTNDRSDSPIRHGSGLRCAGCSGAIAGRIVSAMGSRWHPHCFKCDDCGTLLEHVSSYEHDGRAYCHLDYHDRFAPRCYHCKTPIVDERFIALDDPALGGQRYYHELHFFCAECGDPFLDPSASSAAPPAARGQIFGEGDRDDDVGFTVFNGHPYCESCHVRLRMPRCGSSSKSGRPGPPGVGCGKPIREEAIEALGRKWHWKCFTCDSCKKPFEDPSFFQRGDSAFCDPCYRILLKNEF